MDRFENYPGYVASRADLLSWLGDADPDDDEPVEVLVRDLAQLRVDDLPIGVTIAPIDKIDSKGTRYVSFDGVLVRRGDGQLVAQIRLEAWRKFWSGPLGVDEYQSLVCKRRSKTGAVVI